MLDLANFDPSQLSEAVFQSNHGTTKKPEPNTLEPQNSAIQSKQNQA
jgi:hypothetical protein